MLYFGYGSNMDWDQIRGRCPSAKFICIARLEDHRLCFPRGSITRKCGVAGIEAAKGEEVWGAVFQIDELDVGHLDKSEGYRPGRESNSYKRCEVLVFGKGNKAAPIKASTYFPIPQLAPPRPNQAYKAIILKGARHWRLPDDYIRALEAIET